SEPCLYLLGFKRRLHASDQIEPLNLVSVRPVIRLGDQWEPEIGRIAAHCVAVEPLWCYSGNRIRRAVDIDCRADYGCVAGKAVLPSVVVEYYHPWRSRGIVQRRKQSAGEWCNPEHRKIISGSVLGFERLDCLTAGTANTQIRQVRLKGGKFSKFGRVVAEVLVQSIRIENEAAIVLSAGNYAAVVIVSQSVEVLWIRDW